MTALGNHSSSVFFFLSFPCFFFFFFLSSFFNNHSKMEDNNTPEVPITCTAGCGFYGNKIYNNMCSKCFKELEKKNNDRKVSIRNDVNFKY